MKKLHIISFTIPYPPNYGGVIDVFYKLKSLSAHISEIDLHCFQYDRNEAIALKEYANTYYYQRKKTILKIVSSTPFIVKSRENKKLLYQLLQDDAPILFEGIHSCAYLDHPKLANRKKIVRLHNVEWKYYHELAKIEPNPLKRTYFSSESKKLKEFEQQLANADVLVTIAQPEFDYYKTLFPNKQVEYIPAFHQFHSVDIDEQPSDFALYHGDLSVIDNELAAKQLIEQVFAPLGVKAIIAGLNPSNSLKQLVEQYSAITLIDSPSTTAMNQFIAKAQVNVFISNQPTGMKLKLMHALFHGKHCLVNQNMVEASNAIKQLCHIENEVDGMKVKLMELMKRPFQHVESLARERMLTQEFSNKKNAMNFLSYFLD